ncbi:ATP-binding cassette domain-containing protein, partial [Klebsiella pneumoniae]
MSFDVNPGEVVTLLGRNGAGKTTTMRAIMG